jgi:hypothetical protein
MIDRACRLPCRTFFLVIMLTRLVAQTASFPSVRAETHSPNHLYLVRNEDQGGKEPAHTLIFVDRQSKKETSFYRYGRSVELLWSPLSDAFVINDHQGSDSSKPLLFTVPLQQGPVDLWSQLLDFLREQHNTSSALNNHHVYLSAVKWLDRRKILCKLTAYGEQDPQGFTKFYVFDTKQGFRLARHQR